MLASELFATSQGATCEGPSECHWCGAACARIWPHDDSPPVPFSKARSPAKRPGNQYICTACWLWRRQRVTVPFLHGEYLDGQSPMRHSWLITAEGAWAIRGESWNKLYPFLLKPPTTFVLALVDGKDANQLQCAVVNDNAVVSADTPLVFTVNNIAFAYNIYELEQAIRHGADGKAGGVQALVRMHKPDRSLLEPEEPAKKNRGRPPKTEEADGRVASRMIRRSGYETVLAS
jgi:hypothetical protein